MSDIVMPKLSDTMTEGTVVSWKKRVGEQVRRGEVIAEVETDKANMELEAFASGVLLEIKVEAGKVAQVGTVIAVIGQPTEKGEGGQQPPAQPESPAPPERQAQAETGAKREPEAIGKPAPGTAPSQEGPAQEQTEKGQAAPGPEGAEAPAPPEPGIQAHVAGQEPQLEKAMEMGGFQTVQEPGAEKGASVEKAPPPPEASGAAGAPGPGAAEGGGSGAFRERAAPVVRRRARELDIDLGAVRGSGPEGRILLADLEAAERGEAKPAQPAAAPQPQAAKAPPAAAVEREAGEPGPAPFSRLRAAVAKTVSDSWRQAPHFGVTMDIVMDQADALRSQLKQAGIPVTFNDLVVKGVALALQGFPNLNASLAEGGRQLHREINIGVAVGMPDGVLMPVIRGCQRLSLAEISQAARTLAERARSGALTEQEMSGGTFSVSNLGMYGISDFTAIIYPGEAAVLAVGAVADAVVARDGKPACAKVMKVTLCADHRLTDGAYAAEFLVELKRVLESPFRLLL